MYSHHICDKCFLKWIPNNYTDPCPACAKDARIADLERQLQEAKEGFAKCYVAMIHLGCCSSIPPQFYKYIDEVMQISGPLPTAFVKGSPNGE